jgi:hypothetical protein
MSMTLMSVSAPAIVQEIASVRERAVEEDDT